MQFSNGSLNTFKYLLSIESLNDKIQTNVEFDGLRLIHLSIIKSIFSSKKRKCLEIFKYIYNNFPEQRKYRDRLVLTYLYLIFEYNFSKSLEK